VHDFAYFNFDDRYDIEPATGLARACAARQGLRICLLLRRRTRHKTKPWSLGAHWTGRHGRCDDENGQVHDFAWLLTTAMTSNPPPGHCKRTRRGKGCVYACCFAGAQGMGRSHGRLVHIGPGAMGAVTTKTAKGTISPSY